MSALLAALIVGLVLLALAVDLAAAIEWLRRLVARHCGDERVERDAR